MSVQEKLFFDGIEYFTDLERDIELSQDQIILECYIFQKDQLTTRIVEALKRAEQRGVEVRILVDGIGSPRWYSDWINELKKFKIESRIYHPVPWSLHVARVEGLFRLKRLIQFFGNLNSRNHRKYCLIDRKILYVTGFNLAQEHARWRDNAVRLEWPQVQIENHKQPIHAVAVDEVLIAFKKAWKKAWRPKFKNKLSRKRIVHYNKKIRIQESEIRLNTNLRLRNFHYNEFIKKLNLAKTQIMIVNPYFVPSLRILNAFRNAAFRGVEIKIIVPDVSDVKIVQMAAHYFYQKLLQSKVQLYKYKKTILHAKTVMIDDWCMVGSSNLNSRSVFHDLELDIIIQRDENKLKLKNQFLEDLRNSEPITIGDLNNLPLYVKIFIRMLLWIKYWM